MAFFLAVGWHLGDVCRQVVVYPRASGCWRQFYGLRFRGSRGAVDANIYYYLNFGNVLATAYQTIENVADMAHVTIENVIIIYDHRVRDHFDYDNRTRCLKSI